MEPQLTLVLERIETAFKTHKPFIQLQDALVLYSAVINMHNRLADKVPIHILK